MWAVSAFLGVVAAILVYRGLIELSGLLSMAGIIVAFIALFALFFTIGDGED